ncbi:MAG: T9SS type A sorting domain-containing protein [Bacteroidetes bacterium]|nr:T9SS type A sorting domain-containing protein [Bacteroidota bacterium]
MKKIYNLFIGLLITGSIANAQVVFQSNLSSWSGGLPTDIGSSTNVTLSNITEVAAPMYGTSAAAIKNTTTSHKRFSTQTVNVDSSGTYEIKVWVKASAGQLRTGHYYITNTSTTGYGTYNPYVDLSTASAGNLVMITQTVTVVSTADSAQFILSFHSTDGVTDLIVDSIHISSSTPPVGIPVTINQIQFTTTPPYDSPYDGQLVETSGIVTAVKFNGYFLQDGIGAYNGIFVLDYINAPSIGDNVTVTGNVDEYFNLTEIANPSVYTVNSTGNTLPAPYNVAAATFNVEGNEGVLVKVVNEQCTSDTTTNTLQEWRMSYLIDTVIVKGSIYKFNPTIGLNYDVTGVVDYNFGYFKLLPRDANDIQLATSIEEINNYKVSVYPNPVQNQLNFELNSSNFSVKIIDVTGKTISYTSTLSNKLKVNTTSLNNGIYFYSVLNNNGEMITSNKFVVAK